MRRTPELAANCWPTCIEVKNMVKLDRIEHTVTIPEGVTANISEDGVVTITGQGTLTRASKAMWFNSSKTAPA